jgi:hypothetical protein
MSKATSRKSTSAAGRRSSGPSAASLSEMPEIDFSRYRARRNPFAARIAREGIEVVRDEPSPESLAEIPEVDFTQYRVRRNPYVSRAGEAAATMQYGRGRPPKHLETGPTRVRSVRLPESVWKALDAEAKRRKTSTHALVRELIAMFVERLATG